MNLYLMICEDLSMLNTVFTCLDSMATITLISKSAWQLIKLDHHLIVENDF